MIKLLNDSYATKSERATLAEELRELFQHLAERIQSDVAILYGFDAETKGELIQYQLERTRWPLCSLSTAERMSMRLQLYRTISRRLVRSCSEINLVDWVVAEKGGAPR
jgi:hypothetical protein